VVEAVAALPPLGDAPVAADDFVPFFFFTGRAGECILR